MSANTIDRVSHFLAGLPEREGFGDATRVRHRPDSINLSGGNPGVDGLPADLFKAASADLFEDPHTVATILKYSPAAGLAALREAIGAREGIDPARVLVTTGGAHSTALAVLGILNPGDTVVVDAPIYPLFLRNLDLVGVEIASVPVDAQGLDVEVLERKLLAGLRPKALYTVPTFHNPTGAVLSLEREERLVKLAERYGFTIIADDPYRELSFTGERPRPRPALIDTDHAVLVNSFSKTLGPGARIGWLGLPEELVPEYVKLRSRLDCQTSGIVQELVRRIITEPTYEESVVAAGARYREKATTLMSTLRDQFQDAIDWVEPTGGFFLWAWLTESIDYDAFFEAAGSIGVTLQRGEWFAAQPDSASDLKHAFRLSFCEADEDALREGANRLGAAWREVR